MNRILLLFLPVLAAGLAFSVATWAKRDDDPQFALDQGREARVLDERTLERAVASAPEPGPSREQRPARDINCVAADARKTRWRCAARYRSGYRRLYHVVIQPNGRFRGATKNGVYIVSGQLPGY